jgi:hypothetical protein
MVPMSGDVAVKQGEGLCSRIQSIEKRTFYGNTPRRGGLRDAEGMEDLTGGAE